MATLAPTIRIGSQWDDIQSANCPLVIQNRAFPFARSVLADLLDQPASDLRLSGTPDQLADQLKDLPEPLAEDALMLAQRFARFMRVYSLRLRLERIDSNACRKLHADYTDVRLLCTYAGPGTDYLADPGEPEQLLRMDAGWVGLFKGRNFTPGHEPAFHRSPPIEGTGAKRLLLVIDTPLPPELAQA